ncbi:MAG: DUF2971 domain-containing protein [Lachnospiraceae bacterium]|nr:DUF2971 domain-containing protein [Lachnospiraceae bacterium]
MDNLIYHYTSFEKLQCILKYGTLRFKESTSSNDILDTIGFVNILKDMPRFNAPNGASALLNFIIDYYQRENYKPSAKFLVACFSKIPDSRLLWDAYTMHRPGNLKCPHGENKYCYEATSKYDGVCIAFKKDILEEFLHSQEGEKYDKSHMQSISYGDEKIKIFLNEWLKEAAYKSIMLGKDEDQSQDIIPPIPVIGDTYMCLKKSLVIPTLEFMQNVEAYSPFFKHAFWHEEAEVRASLLISNASLPKYDVLEYVDGTKYYDLEIPADCIDHIILGPEFDSQSFAEIDTHTEYKLHFRNFELRTSLGTGVIRNQ